MIFKMDTQINITGTEIAYLYICRRKLWLFHHGIRPENEYGNVQIGRFIQETTFTRHEDKKEIVLGTIGVVDWAEINRGIIHEIKKSKAPARAEDAQVRYYMWWMRTHGMNIHTAIIHYPKQRRTRKLPWTQNMEETVLKDLFDARNVVKSPAPPGLNSMAICKSCAYQEFCFA